MEDRKQKEMRLRNTWFLLPIDDEDNQGMYDNEDITFKGSSSRLYDKKRDKGRMKDEERRQDIQRDEWRTCMKKPSALSTPEGVKAMRVSEKMVEKAPVTSLHSEFSTGLAGVAA